MIDPALGRSRADRALGEERYKKRGVRTDQARSKAFGYYGIRDENVGIFGDVRGKYQRYSASEAAADVVTKRVRGRGTK